VSLLAAGRVGDRLRSLTVIEPPAFGLARGDPAVEALVEQLTRIGEEAREPRAYVMRFAAAVGAKLAPPDPLPPAAEAVIRASMAERPPWEAVIPFDAIRDAGTPVLVVSGGHHPAFDAVCDVLERELDAERAVLPGSGHSVQRLGAPFNERVAAFIEAHGL
jgi:pimeloyl-ACP methyl ester carboxylesterase